MTAKLSASADGTKVIIGTAAEDALQIDATAKAITAVSPYSITATDPTKLPLAGGNLTGALNIRNGANLGLLEATNNNVWNLTNDGNTFVLNYNAQPAALYVDGTKVALSSGRSVQLADSNGNQLDVAYTAGAGFALSFAGTRRFTVEAGGFVVAPYIGAGGGTPVAIDGSGYLRANTSSRRYKKDIEPIDIGLDFVNTLAPVKFNLKDGDVPQVGFIAEDFPDSRFVNEALIDPADPSKGAQVVSVSYDRITAVLVKAVQELAARVAELESR